MLTFFKKHPAITLGSLAALRTLIDNYWIFTSMPMAASDHSDSTAKVFYMGGQIALNAALYGFLGYYLGQVLDASPELLSLRNSVR